jgi:hypothetical protein
MHTSNNNTLSTIEERDLRDMNTLRSSEQVLEHNLIAEMRPPLQERSPFH